MLLLKVVITRILRYLSSRWEGERLELVQTIEAEKLASREALKPLEELRVEHKKLVEASH